MHQHFFIDIYSSDSAADPANSENIRDPARFANGGPLFLKVAPDNVVHPVDALRRYLLTHAVDEVTDGLGRVIAVTGIPVSEYGGEDIVKPTQGAGLNG